MPSSRQLEAYKQMLPVGLRVLPTMPMRIFRQKISKTFKAIGSKHVSLWLRMNDDTLVEMAQDDDRDLSWWGIDNGSDIFTYFE
jgi:tubulin-specific chaperone E